MVPTMLPLPSSIEADILTGGDDCAVALLCKLNITTQGVPAFSPDDVAVSTSCPKLCVHEPTSPRRSDVEVNAKPGESAVCEPVRPEIVTVDPAARLKFAVSVTVNVLMVSHAGVS